MRFVSTRNSNRRQAECKTFQEAIFQGLASDGGLYQPEVTPDLRELIHGFSTDDSFVDITASLTAALFPNEIPYSDALSLAKKAFSFTPRISHQEDISLLELFYGPSYSFKDFGVNYLATCMEYFLVGENKRAVILTATSGDTGSAVALAFHRKKNIDVLILYPSARVSPNQEKQFTTLGENIHALEVQGSFDDCQRMVKEAFFVPQLSHIPLTSANSINIGRLIPQSFYYVYAAIQMDPKQKLFFVVPSGNFGNLIAGIYAWQWGLPVHGFIAATNRNDVVPQYLDSGIFTPRPSVQTYANAMDVGNPSNIERLQSIFRGDLSAMRKIIRAYAVSDEDILNTIKVNYEKTGLFCCPHTAAGLFTAEKFQNLDTHLMVLATAHPAKFNEIMEKACAVASPIPAGIAESMQREKQSTLIGNRVDNLSSFLLELDKK